MKFLFATAVVFLLTPNLLGQDVGSTPYAALLKAARIDASDVPGIGARSLHFTVRSTLPTVAPTDITLTLVTKSKSQSIHVDESGEFLLPLSEAYLKDNAEIRTNQPKRTVVFRVSVAWDRAELTFDPVKNGMRIRYTDLFPSTEAFRRALAAADEIQEDRSVDGVTTKSTRTKSVIFTIADVRMESSVKVDFDDRSIALAPIREGTYRVAYRRDWLQSNPWIVIQPLGGWDVEYESEPLAQKKTEPSRAPEPGLRPLPNGKQNLPAR